MSGLRDQETFINCGRALGWSEPPHNENLLHGLGIGRDREDNMNPNQPWLTVEGRRLAAKRLVSELDAAELLVLVALVGGMSKRAIAAGPGHDPAGVERTFVSLMAKLKAATIADAVRIGLYAEVGRSD